MCSSKVLSVTSNNVIFPSVKCAKRPAAFATYTMFDGCIGDSRGQITGCLAEAVLQPDDDGTILYSKCLPSGQYSDSDMFCGSKFMYFRVCAGYSHLNPEHCHMELISC